MIVAAACIASSVTAQAGAVNQTFFLPVPEAHLRTTFSTIRAGGGNTIDSIFSIVVTAPDTVLYYDHWEDGYEPDLGNPTNIWSMSNPGGTQIWGDGDDANGIPPGFAHDTNLWSGAVITLRNYVTLPRNPAQIFFDARDILGASKPVIMTRAGWASNIGPIQAFAVEVPSVADHGTHYICPVGEDVDSYNKFQYVGMYILADYDATEITLDTDGNGPIPAVTFTLNRGGAYHVNGGLKKGAYVKSSQPVLVNLVTGNKTVSYESRSYTLRPVERWSDCYLTPVGAAANGWPAAMFLFNTNAAPLVVRYQSQQAGSYLTIPGNNGVLEFALPRNSGSLFTSTNGMPFNLICAAGADPTRGNYYDWGFAPMPFDGLTAEARIGWGAGSADLSRNGSPVWVTAATNTTVYIDYRGDYQGPLVDPVGQHYDVAYSLAPLQARTVYAPGNDQTGMRLYTLDDTPISVAWGEDAAVAQQGSPYLDMGTASLPFPVKRLKKNGVMISDVEPLGISVSDVVEYTVVFVNQGVLPAMAVIVVDDMPPALMYVTNSTKLDGVPIPDDISGTPFPLDPPGYFIPFIKAGGSNVITYSTMVADDAGELVNRVQAEGLIVSNDLRDPIISTCTVAFTDAAVAPVSLYSIGDYLYLSLDDRAANRNPAAFDYVTITIHDATTGDAEPLLLRETGPNTGRFFPTNGLLSSATAGALTNDGILFVGPGDAVTVAYTNDDYIVCDAVAYFRIPPTTNAQNKVLYLEENGFSLDRIDPVAAGDTSTSQRQFDNQRALTWTQSPAFGLPFTMPAGGTIIISNFVRRSSGNIPVNPNYTAQLLVDGVPFFSANNPLRTYENSPRRTNIVWTGILAGNVTVDAGQTITFLVSNAQANAFQLYDSTFCPAKIILPTTNVISVDAVDVYDAPYPAGALVAASHTGAVRYVRITASDPFGAYDINGVYLKIDGPGNGADRDVMLIETNVVATNSHMKTYEFRWPTTATPGLYALFATAYEGTEGITASSAGSHTLYRPGARTASATEFTTGANGPHTLVYQTNETVFVRVTDLDQDTGYSIQTVNVTIRSSAGDVETRTLFETSFDSGVFTGAVRATATGTATPENGILTAPAGAALTVTYTDVVDTNDVSGDSAVVLNAALTKPLYFSDPTQALDRIDPVAAGDTTTAQTDLILASGNIAVANVTTNTLNGTGNLTIAHTTSAGDKRLMIVGISCEDDNENGGIQVTNVTYQNRTLSQLIRRQQNEAYSEIWYLLDPPTGAGNVTITRIRTEAADSIAAGVITFTGVDQTTPFGTPGGANGNSSSASLTITSAVGEVAVDVFAMDDGRTATPGAGQSTFWNIRTESGNDGVRAVATSKPGTNLVTFSYSASAVDWWALCAVSIRPAIVSNAMVFTQAPPFALPCALVGGTPVAITAYVAIAGGTMPTNPAVTATLYAGNSHILSLANPVYNAASSNLVWYGTLPSGVTVPAGERISLAITNFQAGVSFRIYFDSVAYPSKLLLQTTNAIAVTSVAVYNTGGMPVSSLPKGEVRYVRVTVTDPFGAYDINGVDLTITATGMLGSINVTLSNQHVIASNAYAKTYAYQWIPTVPGVYSIFAVAREGTEGVTAQGAGWHNVSAATRSPASAEFTDSLNGMPTALYPTNATVFVRVTDQDVNSNAAAVETCYVTVVNDVSGDSETILLTETSTNSGVFVAALPASTFAGQFWNDGVLLAPAGSIITVTYIDPGDASDVAVAAAQIESVPIPIKPLYFSDPTQSLDRVDPVATVDLTTTSTPVAASFVFRQVPAFGLPFSMAAGDAIGITAYVAIASGSMPTNPTIGVALSAGGTNFFTAASAVYNPAGSNLVWNGALAGSVTIASNQFVTLLITNTQPGVTFRILYDSTAYPSKLLLPTTNIIRVARLGLYDMDGNEIVGSAYNGEPLFIRATVTDPFGAADITSLGLVIDGPGSFGDISLVLSNTSVSATGAYEKTYEYLWITPPGTGEYTITVTAHEGTEGLIDSASTVLQLSWDNGHTPSFTEFFTGPNGPITHSYQTNERVWVRVRDYDRNLNPVVIETVTITVTNETFGDIESLVLYEVGPNSGIFTGNVPASVTLGGVPYDGTLRAPAGSQLIAFYQDPFDLADTSTDRAVVVLPGPAISAQKLLTNPAFGPALPGDYVQFVVRAINIGNTTQSTVSVVDTFPTGALTFAAATPAPTITGALALTWSNVGPLAPGGYRDIALSFRAYASATNRAVVTAGALVATGAAAVAVVAPAVTVTKVPLTAGPVLVGSLVDYRIVVRNDGNTRIASLPLQDIGDSYDYISATIPPDGFGGGFITWNNIISGGYLNVGAAITNTLTLRVTKAGNPALNEVQTTFVVDELGNPVPDAHCITGIVAVAAAIKGIVYNDADTNGYYSPGDTGLPGVELRLYTDPFGDGSASNGVLVGTAHTIANGSYQFINLSTGRYVVIETVPLGYVASSPTRLAVNVVTFADYTNRNFFVYIPPPSSYSLIGGSVINDVNGNGLPDDTQRLANVTVALFQDNNSNGVIDVGETAIQTTASSTNGVFLFSAVPVGYYVLRETDPPGYVSTSSNQLPVIATSGSVQTNFYFLDKYLPPFLDITNATLSVDYDVAALPVAGTNNLTIVGSMWITNASAGGAAQFFSAALGWTTPAIALLPGTNIVRVFGANALGSRTNDTVLIIRGHPETKLLLTKTATPSAVEPGGQLVYHVAISNTSVYAIPNVTLTETYPGGFTATVAQRAGGPVWVLGPILAHSNVSVIIGGYVSTGAIVGTHLTNFVAVTANWSTRSTNVVTPIIAPTNLPAELLPALTAQPPSGTNGQTVVFTLTIANTGIAPASNVTATAAFPPGLLPVGAASWSLGTLPIGETVTITFTGTIYNAIIGSTIVLPATVTAVNAEPKATWVEIKVLPVPLPPALLRISKSASQTSVFPGQTLAYVIAVSNAGPAAATNVVVTDIFPPLFTFVEAAPLPLQPGNTKWSLGTMAAGVERRILISGYVATNARPGEWLHNTAVAACSNGVSTNAAVAVLVTNPPPVTAPLLRVFVTDSADPVTNGQQLIYTLRIQNIGGAPASNVTLGLVLDSAYSPAALPSTNLGIIAVGADVLLTVTGTVVNATIGGALEIIVTARPSNGAWVTATEQTRVVAVTLPLLLDITKTANPIAPIPGGPLAYTIVARNIGAMTATNVIIRENFDGFYSCTGSVPTASRQPPPEWEWTLGNLPVGIARTVTVAGVVAANVSPGTTLRNNVEVWSDNARKVETNLLTVVALPPIIGITNLTDRYVVPFRVMSQVVAGISSNLIGMMWYTSIGPSGTAAGSFPASNRWSQFILLPRYGGYVFTVFGTNASGSTASNTVSLTRQKHRIMWSPQ